MRLYTVIRYECELKIEANREKNVDNAVVFPNTVHELFFSDE